MQRCVLPGLVACLSMCMPAAGLDLKNAVVVTPRNLSLQEKTAVAVLVEEVQKRTQMRLVVQTVMPAGGAPAIIVGTSANFTVGMSAVLLTADQL